jgi:serine protease AprX
MDPWSTGRYSRRTTMHLSQRIAAILAAVIVAIPVVSAPASAAPFNPARLDDEVVRRLQSTPAAQRIPVIIEGAADPDATTTGGASERRAKRVENRVRGNGGHVVTTLNLLGAIVAELTPDQIRALAVDGSVARIHFDTAVHASAVDDTASASDTPVTFAQSIGAPAAWSAGTTGSGVTVAVLDTGIANSPAFGARVKARVDLVDPARPAQGDPAGHGTHVAGIIAGGRASAAPGIAPDADLVSIRVLDANGQSRLSTVMLGLEWAVAHKSSLGIDVVVMALGAPAEGSYRDDPLAAAAEMVWRSGLLVVAAAGNDGPGASTIETPGIDPLILTIGATDEAGTPWLRDDTVPTWSSQGPTRDGFAKPDLVAPGRKLVSLRVPGGTIDKLAPDHIEGPTTTRMSGTSQATAVTGGAAALLLQQRPNLKPDEVKALLVDSARPLAGSARPAQGAGSLDVSRALNTRTPRVTAQHIAPSTALMRALMPHLRPVLRGTHVGSTQVLWDQVLWDQVLWDQVLWDQVLWDQVLWDQVLWDQVLSD